MVKTAGFVLKKYHGIIIVLLRCNSYMTYNEYIIKILYSIIHVCIAIGLTELKAKQKICFTKNVSMLKSSQHRSI